MFRRVQRRVQSVNSPSQRRLFASGVCLGLLFGLLPLFASASPFYDYKIVAKSGDTIGGFTAQTFKQLVSINDHGWVAFIAESATGGKAVILAEPGPISYVRHNMAETTTGDYGAVSLNNHNTVVASFRVTSQGIINAHVRRYSW